MKLGKNNSINRLLIFHFNVAVLMLDILSFIFCRLSNYNVNNFTKLLEVIDDLLSNGIGIAIGNDLVNKNLVIMIVSANMDSIIANFYCFELAEFGG